MLLHLVAASTWHCTLGKLLAWGLPECLQDLLAPPSHIPHSPSPQTFCHLNPTANIWRMIVQILKRCCCNYLIFGRRRPKYELWEDFSFFQSLTGEFTPKSKYLIIDIWPPLRGLELMRDTRKTIVVLSSLPPCLVHTDTPMCTWRISGKLFFDEQQGGVAGIINLRKGYIPPWKADDPAGMENMSNGSESDTSEFCSIAQLILSEVLKDKA